MTELLPCPFCLKTPKEVDYMGFKWAECLTNDCALFDQMIKAKAWQSRANLSPSPDAERLASVLKNLWNEKRPAYHDCLDNGEPECVWCIAEKTLADFEKGGLK